MKKSLAILASLLVAFTSVVRAQEKCISEYMYREAVAKDPSVADRRRELDMFTKQYTSATTARRHVASKMATPATYVIPVVFHVIHTYGTENISDAQILDQIRILNLDYRALNADTTTAANRAFRALMGDANVEFRLATKDPQGNCTTGINRVYSWLTDNARDNVKALSYWPRNKYLNIWVVRSIANTNGTAGDGIGFAQFPVGAWGTDGVVIRYDFVGSIGQASNLSTGRTGTHEIGHWLNLRHIWGDDAGLCTFNGGFDDQVNDTPEQGDWNLSTSPTWPELDACTTTSPGCMFNNYMDYSDEHVINMFSLEQCARMESALLGDTARFKVWQQSNLTATGVDVPNSCTAARHADFNPKPYFICPGGVVNFKDVSWGGVAGTRTWTFTGGSPATDTASSVNVTYANPGTYDVMLTVSNGAGSDTKTVVGAVVVSQAGTSTFAPVAEGFETGTWPFNDWYVLNTNGGTSWVQGTTGSTGTKSVTINNFTGNTGKGPDELITAAYNLSNVSGAGKMKWKSAFAWRSSSLTNGDKLEIYVSNSCGQIWSVRGTRTGTALSTTTNPVSFTFTPTAAQWRADSISIPNLNLKANTRFKFVFTHDAGNNIYLDDINITGTITTGLNDLEGSDEAVLIYPNPSSATTYVEFSTERPSLVKIDVYDTEGRLMSNYSEDLPDGDHQYTISDKLENGVYFVRITMGDKVVTKRVVIQ